MKHFLLFLFVLVSVTLSHAQTVFQKNYSFSGFNNVVPADMVEADDGGFIIVGSIMSSVSKPFILKTKRNGEIVWAKTNDFPVHAFFSDIEKTNDGNFLISGYKQQWANSIDDSVFIFKINHEGELLFTRKFSPPPGFNFFHNGTQGNDIKTKQLAGSGFIIAQSVVTIDTPYISFVNLIKIGETGDVEWSLNIDSNLNWISDFDVAVPESKSGFTVLSSALYDQTMLTHISENGNVIWSQRISSGAQPFVTGVHGKILIATIDNGYLISGHVIDTTDLNNPLIPFVIKTDSMGLMNNIWRIAISSDEVYVRSGTRTTDGGALILLQLSYEKLPVIWKTDFNGNTEWVRRLGNVDASYSYPLPVLQASDSSIDCPFAHLDSILYGGVYHDHYFFSVNLTCADKYGTTFCEDGEANYTLSLLNLFSNDSTEQRTVFVSGFSEQITERELSVTGELICDISIPTHEDTVFISPNPFNDYFYINITNAETDAEIELYDLLGRIVYSGIITRTGNNIVAEFYLPFLSSALYILKVKINGEVHTYKMVKQ